MSETTGHDMSRFWRLVNNDGGLVTGTWWVTQPDKHGTQHVSPVEVTMWDEARRSGLILNERNFTAFVNDRKIEKRPPIRSRHVYIEAEAKNRWDEIEAVILVVAEAPEWTEAPR